MVGVKPPSGQASLPTPNSTKSFWHREPSSTLLGHRTTLSLPRETDVVIIGSGISGACAAHFLREDVYGKDLNVVMLEAREACWGATGRNGGHCQPLMYRTPPEISAFELRNFQALKALVEDNNIPCEWKSGPGCHTYMDESMFLASLKEVRTLQKTHPELAKHIKVITPKSQNPSLEDLRIPDASGALLQANAASLWPYKLICWILENLLLGNQSSYGGKFNLQTNTPVHHLQKLTGHMSGKWFVHTSRGMIATKKILLTTNGYTSHLLPAFSDLIVPVRGEMSALIPPPALNPSNITSIHQPLQATYYFMGLGKKNVKRDDYLVQRPFSKSFSQKKTGGELMFGGGRAYAAHGGIGVSDDSSIDEPAAEYLRNELNETLDLQNDSQELKATYEWSGIMGYSRDGRPWVGEVSEDVSLGGGKGLWICAGFTGHGMPNTCLSAKAVAGMMVGRMDVDLPRIYELDRERVERVRNQHEEVHIADAKGAFSAFY